MKKIRFATIVVLAGVIAWGAGCGPQGGQTTPAAPREPAESGEALAQEILAAFDEMVAKAAALAEGKPEGAALRAQLEELYAEYEVKMAAFNVRFLKLRDDEPREFGNANGYMGSHRGRHVTQKDYTLTEAMRYYNHEIGDRETVEVLTRGPVRVLEIAVKM